MDYVIVECSLKWQYISHSAYAKNVAQTFFVQGKLCIRFLHWTLYTLMKSDCTQSQFAHGLDLHMDSSPYGLALHMVQLTTWSSSAHSLALHMVQLSTWSSTAHGLALHMVQLCTWSHTLHCITAPGLRLHMVLLCSLSQSAHGHNFKWHHSAHGLMFLFDSLHTWFHSARCVTLQIGQGHTLHVF